MLALKTQKDMLISAGIVLAFVLLIVISVISYSRTSQFLLSSRWVDHTYTVLSQINLLFSELKDAETSQRGFLLTNDEKFLEPYNKAVSNLPETIQRLKTLTKDNFDQQDDIALFEELANRKLLFLEQAINMQRQYAWKGNDDILNTLQGGKKTMDELRMNIQRMTLREEKLLDQRAELEKSHAVSTERWIFFGNLAAILLILISFCLLRQQIKERINAQRRAEKTALQLEVTNKELESFSYSVSHDLRSPLRAIDGYSRMFEEDYSDKVDDEGKRMLGVVRANSKKMRMLIDDLLDFARTGRQAMERDEINMGQLVDEVWVEVLSAEQPNPSLQFYKHHLHPVLGDPVLLKQLLSNLLSNAVKYSSTKEHPKVEITSIEKDGEITYQIHDNGVGFDMRYYKKLFGVFQRLHTADEFPGTGVGLAIVQRIILRHNGRVWAESEIGVGSTFSFSLPVKGV
ncbi:MAG: CHASE3 domain-containing protein [Methylophilaceae bacterium]|nr:CHASE3 domain-containing protein [Methyloradius sp.]